MADMLTYKELVPTKNVKEIDAHVEPSNEPEVILEKVEGVLYFDGAYRGEPRGCINEHAHRQQCYGHDHIISRGENLP